MFFFVWHLSFELSGLGDPTSGYAIPGMGFRVSGARKPPHPKKEGTIWTCTLIVN